MPDNQFNIDPEIIAEFTDESLEMLGKAVNCFIVLESNPDNREALDTIFRAVHTIKGNSAFFGLLRTKSLAHRMEDLMALARKGDISLSKSVIDILIKGIEQLESIIRRVKEGGKELEEQDPYQCILESINAVVKDKESFQAKGDAYKIWAGMLEHVNNFKSRFSGDSSQKELLEKLISELSVFSPKDEKNEGFKAEEKINSGQDAGMPAKGAAPLKDKSAKTMRIPEISLDHFLGFVGELIVVREMYEYAQIQLLESYGPAKELLDLKRNNETFGNVAYNLQKCVLELRKVPVKNLTERAPRIIREAALSKNKEIKLVVDDDGVMIDKSLVDSLEGPFMHILRNAVDHGIESVEIRKNKGKAFQGMISIGVKEDKDNILMVIRDDGSGIDKDAVTSKAVSQGLLPAEKVPFLSEQEVYDLLFIPGFSTAKEITDISGRGVGMDVVKKNIDAIGGKIFIESISGKGTSFRLQLPKSIDVRIIQGLVVLDNKRRFILPLEAVGKSFQIINSSIGKFPDGRKYILHCGSVYPLVELSLFLAKNMDVSLAKDSCVGIIIQGKTKKYVLSVDEIIGIQRVVVKDIENLERLPGFVSGGAILGDEKVALVLNPEKFDSA